MKSLSRIPCLIALLATLAVPRCASAHAAAGADPGAGKLALIATDEAFSRMAQERGLTEAFVSYAAPDATMMPVNQNPVTGRDVHMSDLTYAPGERGPGIQFVSNDPRSNRSIRRIRA